MSHTVIEAEHLKKSYILTHRKAARYMTLRDVMADKVKSVFRKDRGFDRREEFLALNDISFQISNGERVGIIGRNGAGKSTLLKILSRIVSPTGGQVIIEGRVASLLEVGTGFHPELSGRENIYLNGSILGMKRSEISSRFDEIVDFAEVEKFLDTPVKRYSSGMYVRLAFAVAAHLEPEILIVDEVLAVGDAQFQQKCLGKMEDVSRTGRTVLFVSHNISAIQKLCNKGLLLDKGRLVSQGPIDEVTNAYLSSAAQNKISIEKDNANNNTGFPLELSVEGLNHELLNDIPVGRPFQVRIKFELFRDVEHFIVALGINSSGHVIIRTSYSEPTSLKKGIYEAVFIYDDIILSTGGYYFVLGLSSYENSFYYKENIAPLQISEVSELTGDKRIIRTSGVGFVINPVSVQINKL